MRHCWQEGHKYLFSDATHTWDEALTECELYGGWLVNIGSVTEQNCLMRFGHSKTELSMDKWYWTDGTDDIWNTGHKSIENIYLKAMPQRPRVCGHTLLTTPP